MIHLVTLNPALDLELDLKDPSVGKIGEVLGSHLQPGGKALNIARFLKKLKVPYTVWLGTGGGAHPTHLLFQALLKKEGLAVRFLSSTAPVRWNIVIGNGKKKQKYNHPGFELDLADFGKLDRSVKKGDFLVLTGRLPQGMNPSLYGAWVKAYGRKGVKVIVDASGKPLLEALKARPWFFKVNLQELSEALGRRIPGLSAIPALKRGLLAKMGLTHGAVTDGANGAIVWDERDMAWVKSSGKPVKGFVVGAGDGFLSGYLKGLESNKNLRDGAILACAAATTVANLGIMNFSRNDVLSSVKTVKVQRLK